MRVLDSDRAAVDSELFKFALSQFASLGSKLGRFHLRDIADGMGERFAADVFPLLRDLRGEHSGPGG